MSNSLSAASCRTQSANPAEFPATRHYSDLDGMRGILAAMVMLYHYGLNTAASALTGGLLIDGQWGFCVDFFFMLSGFVLMHSYLRAPASSVNFAIRRFCRLYPAFIVSLVAALALSPSGPGGVTTAANLLMAQTFFNLSSINFPSWSVPPEFYLPLAAVSLAGKYLGRGGRSTCWVALGFLGFAGAMLTYFSLEHNSPLWISRSAIGLSAGAVLYRSRIGHAHHSNHWLAAWGLLVATMLAMLLAGRFHAISLLLYPLSLVTIWYGSQSHSWLSRGPLHLLGLLSYSLYLLHVPTMELAIRLVGPIDGKVLVKLGTIGATLFLAALCYRVVERPGMRLGQKWVGSRGRSPTAAS